MSNKPMTDYLEDKYGRDHSLTETLNSVNSILNRLSVVEAEVAQIRRQCNSVGSHLTQSATQQYLSAAAEWCDCSSCNAPCASPSPHESRPASLPSPAERA